MNALSLSNIVIVFLVSSLILPSPNKLASVVARNLVSSNGVFKVNLIHRDSPLSPYYNSSLTARERVKRAPLGSISRGHTNDMKLSALISNGGDYLIQISLGTPQVEFIAAADTGSDLIWIQCSPCDTCLSTSSQSFDPTKSSTYNAIPCTSSSCNYIDLTTGCAENSKMDSSSPCVYYSSYGDKTQTLGILATETISLPSPDATSKSLPSSVFGCGFDNQGQIGYQGEGIVGLGQGPASLISQLGSSINYKFSYCLAPLSSGVTSKLTFGAVVTGPAVVSTPFRKANDNTFYVLSLNGITVGDKDNSVQVPTELDVIIDSGTTYTYLPSNIYESVKSAVETAIGLTPVSSPVEASLDLCYDTTESSGSGAQFNPPDVVFHFKGADVVLKALNTFRDVGDDVSCLAMVATNDHPYIFGNIAQVNFQVGYDLQAKQVSFAPADCTNY